MGSVERFESKSIVGAGTASAKALRPGVCLVCLRNSDEAVAGVE